jgi:hypothetical protein
MWWINKKLNNTVDFVIEHDDFVVGCGVGAAIGALIALTLHICMMH